MIIDNIAGSMLPWGSHKGPAVPPPDSDLRPGEYVMRLLFTEFTVQAERKMEAVMAEPPVSRVSLSNSSSADVTDPSYLAGPWADLFYEIAD